MKHKHVEASRETRLWLSQVIIPVGILILLNEEIKYRIATKFNKVKKSIKNKIKKLGS